MRALGLLLGISVVVVCTGCEQRRAPRRPVRQPNRQPWGDRTPGVIPREDRKLREAPKLAEEQLKLQSPDPDVRKSAAQTLSRMAQSDKEAIPALTETLKVKDPEVRGIAARALAERGPEAKRAVPALTEMLRDHATYIVPVWIQPARSGGWGYFGKKTGHVRARAAEALKRLSLQER